MTHQRWIRNLKSILLLFMALIPKVNLKQNTHGIRGELLLGTTAGYGFETTCQPRHRARIMLYEYDSTLFFGDRKGSFCDKANSFLEDVRIAREDAPNRPLILLGHSLGGLLIEQSLINAYNSSDMQYSAILQATTGLCFFATPHAGGSTGLVALGACASRIAMALNFKHDTIIETLKSGSLFTDLLQEQWRHRLDQFDIVSFWGRKDSIVEKKSAIFGLSGNKERQISLNADHSTICRFGTTTVDQDNLTIVKSNLKGLYTRALTAGKMNSDLPTSKIIPHVPVDNKGAFRRNLRYA